MITPKKENAKRFIDTGETIYSFYDEVFVVCPSCDRAASIKIKDLSETGVTRSARLQCLSCTFHKEWPGSWLGPVTGRARQRCTSCGYKWIEVTVKKKKYHQALESVLETTCPTCVNPTYLKLEWTPLRDIRSVTDPFFGLQLWLKTECDQKELWAINGQHLQLLKEYVAASIRQRNPTIALRRTLVATLPQWIKSAKNREVILKAIATLEEKLLSIQ